MALIKWNPTKDLLRFERDFNKLYKSFSDRFGINKRFEEDFADASWAPVADIIENEKSYSIKVHLPGLTKKDVKVTYSNGLLSISGERKEEKESKDSSYYKVERSYGKFYRCFNMPEGIDENRIDAKFENGTLSVEVGKSEEAKPKKVEINVK